MSISGTEASKGAFWKQVMIPIITGALGLFVGTALIHQFIPPPPVELVLPDGSIQIIHVVDVPEYIKDQADRLSELEAEINRLHASYGLRYGEVGNLQTLVEENQLLIDSLDGQVTDLIAQLRETPIVTYGVRINVNGQEVSFNENARPFLMGNATYVPVREIAMALNLSMDYDRSTSTVYIGNRFLGQRASLHLVAPMIEQPRNPGSLPVGSVGFVDSVSINGFTHSNALQFYNNVVSVSGTLFAEHNLNRQFRVLSGYIGRVDGSSRLDATFNFFGDGQLLQSYTLNPDNPPQPIELFVEGVTLLRIDVVLRGWGTPAYALVAYLE